MTIADAVFLAAPLAVLLWLARDAPERVLAVALVGAFRAAVAVGLLQFTPPPQVLELVGDAGGDPARLAQHEHWGVWWPRWLFTLPALALGPVDRSFGPWCAALLSVETFLAYRAATLVAPAVPARILLGLGIGSLVMTVATFMNGRLVVAHAGLALILVAQARAVRDRAFPWWTWPALTAGVLMGHMTSGAGLVAYAQAVAGTVATAAIGGASMRAAGTFAAVLTVALGPLLFGDVWKNLTFFEFDLVALIRHGPGDALVRHPAAAVAVVALAAVVVRAGARVWREGPDAERRTLPAGIAVVLSAAGGVAGWSTLSMGIPAGIVLLAQGAVCGAAWPKRALDVVIGSVLLVAVLPLLAVLAVAVRLTSPGPALYRATRVGRAERPFEQLKLRTMVTGADRGGFRTADADPRITPLGRWLRALSLDELPQLWNVVRGEMSLVGPRPAAPAQLDDYTAAQRAERALVRPGITGPAQVSGRSTLTTAESIALDLDYARRPSAWRDLGILLMTVPAVLSRRGTN